MRKRLTAIVMFVLIMVCTGCAANNGGETTTPQAEKDIVETGNNSEKQEQLTVGITSWSQANENCVILFNTIKEKLEAEAGAKVIIVDAQQDLNTQIDQIDNFIAQDVDAIVGLFVDPNGISPAVLAANKAGIPIFGMTTKSEQGEYYFIGSDEYSMGQLQAEYLKEKTQEDARVLYLMNELGHDSQVQRAAGFKETLEKEMPDIEILAEQQGNTVESAMAVMEDWIMAYPEFDAVVSQTDNGILGAIQALNAAGKTKGVITLSIDGNTEAKEAVKAGKLDATIAQNWTGMGETCAEMIMGLQNGENYDPVTTVECYIIDGDNVDEYLK